MLGTFVPQLNCAFSLPSIDNEKNKINRTLNLFKTIINLIFLLIQATIYNIYFKTTTCPLANREALFVSV